MPLHIDQELVTLYTNYKKQKRINEFTSDDEGKQIRSNDISSPCSFEDDAIDDHGGQDLAELLTAFE